MAQDISLTHRYIPKSDTRNRNLFKEEYYSGTDCKIRFSGEDQTEIASIAYSLQEQLLPIYGYASRTFDTLAVGNRIVNGQYRVTIRNPETQIEGKDIANAIDSWDESSYASGVYEYNIKENQKIQKDEEINGLNNTTSNTTTSEKSSMYNEDDDELIDMIIVINNMHPDRELTDNDKKSLISNFQRKHKLEVNGLIDAATKKAIQDEFVTNFTYEGSQPVYDSDEQTGEPDPQSLNDPYASKFPLNTPLFSSPEMHDNTYVKSVSNINNSFSVVPSKTNSEWYCVTDNDNGKVYYVKASSVKDKVTPSTMRISQLYIEPGLAYNEDGSSNIKTVNIEPGTKFRLIWEPIITNPKTKHTYYKVSFGDGSIVGWVDKSTWELMNK